MPPQAPPSDTRLPYAFERILQEGGGAEWSRLEAQNRLFEKARPLAQLPPLPEGAEILDAGSGTGFWSERLALHHPGARVSCLDRSRELLEGARRRMEASGRPPAALLHQDLRNLDLPQGRFDLVFTSVTLAHVRELEPTLERLLAALKPGGWIAGFEPFQQARSFCAAHPPCPALEGLLEALQAAAADRGSDLSVGLKLAHLLERLGMEAVSLRDYGSALRGEDLRTCVEEVLLPLVRAYLRDRWEAPRLEEALAAARKEAQRPWLWLDFRRAVVLGRRPLGAGATGPGEAPRPD